MRAAVDGTREPATSDRSLTDWVREHRVAWDMTPRFERHGDRLIHVGYDLTLFAQPSREAFPDPGGAESREIHEGLRRLADRVLPRDVAPVACAIDPFDASFRFRRESEWRPEVQLTVEILHAADVFGPADEVERRCGRRIEKALAGLGVQPHRWTPTRDAER